MAHKTSGQIGFADAWLGNNKESLGKQAIKLTIIIIALILMRQVDMMNIWMEKEIQQETKAIHLIFILQRGYGGINYN